jgi:hypothetical protein
LDLVGPQVQFIKKDLGFKLERPEIQAELSELSSSLFVVRCLTLCGQLSSDALSQVGGLPSFVLQLACFSDPVPVRTWLPDPQKALSSQPYPPQSNQQGSPRLDTPLSPHSPSLATTTLKRGVTLQQQAANYNAVNAAISSVPSMTSSPKTPKRDAVPPQSPSSSEAKRPAPSSLSRQVSTLSYKPREDVLPEEADCLTVDVNSLINDLRAVSLDSRVEEEEDNQDVEDSDSNEERSPSSSPPKSWGETFGRKASPPSSPVVPIEQDLAFDNTPDLSDLNVDNLDFSLLEPPPTVKLTLIPPPRDAQGEVVLNLVNYLPGMELVRFSEGLISIEEASALIRFKHEHLGGLFWTSEELHSCISTLGLNMKLLDAFRKPPFPAKVLSILAPQVASRVMCEPFFDNSACFGHMIDVVSSARVFVNLCLPELSHLGLIAALALVAGRGVQVRVLLCGEGPPPSVPGCLVVVVRPSLVLSRWTPEKREQLAQSGVPEEFLMLQDMSRRSLHGQSFPVCLRRAMLVVDGLHSVVGSLRGTASTSHEGVVAIEGSSAARLVHRSFASLWMCLGGHA